MKYIKELDNVRALAILGVLGAHWLPTGNIVNFISSTLAPPDIFFTISGFLITLILLTGRNKAEASETSKLAVCKSFLLKRTLRTLPAYYLLIIIDYYLSKHSLEAYYPYLNYTANIHDYKAGSWGVLPHLWTMAVELQFYFCWPWIILFVPKRFLLPIILLLITIGITSQHLVPVNELSFVFPTTCFDTLGLGALLAWFVVYKPLALVRVKPYLKLLALVCIILVFSQAVYGNFFFLFNRTLLAVATTCLLIHFYLKEAPTKRKRSFLFNNKSLGALGRISYGVYLYHLTFAYYSYELFLRFNRQLPFPDWFNNGILLALEELLLIFVVAWLSWQFIESPIINLKKYILKQKPVLKQEESF